VYRAKFDYIVTGGTEIVCHNDFMPAIGARRYGVAQAVVECAGDEPVGADSVCRQNRPPIEVTQGDGGIVSDRADVVENAVSLHCFALALNVNGFNVRQGFSESFFG